MAVSKNTKKIVLRYVLAPIALLALLYLIYKQLISRGDLETQWKQLEEHLTLANLPWFVLVLVLAPINWGLEALKWQKLLSKIKPIAYARAFKSMLSGMSFSIITPNRVGDFAGRIIHVSKGYKLKAAVSSMIGSVAQMCITASFGFVGLIYFNIYFGSIYTKIALVVAALLVVALLLLFLNFRKLGWFGKRNKWLRKLNVAIRVLRFYSRRDLGYILLLALGRFLIFNTQFLILINILGAEVPYFPGLILSALMYWIISVVRSVALLELGVRGYAGLFLFVDSGISDQPLAILGGSYLLWVINLVLPAVLGSFTILRIRGRE